MYQALVRRLPEPVAFLIAIVLGALVAAVFCCAVGAGCSSRGKTPSVSTPPLKVDPVFGVSAQWKDGPVLGAQLPKIDIGAFEFGSAELGGEVDPLHGVEGQPPAAAPALAPIYAPHPTSYAGPSAAEIEAIVARHRPAPAAPVVVSAPAPAPSDSGPPEGNRLWGWVLVFIILLAAAAVTLYVTKRLGAVTDAIGRFFKGLFSKKTTVAVASASASTTSGSSTTPAPAPVVRAP